MGNFSKEIRAYALKNALDFGKADAAKILPKLFNHGLDTKDIKTIMPDIQTIVREVNTLSQKDREKAFNEFKGIVKEHEEKERTKPNLPQATGKVVTRLPPEPSKYLHLGHALSFIINYVYAKDNKGTCLLRFEDANPEKVAQEYVDATLEDLKEYLGINPESIRFVSDDMEYFYRAAETLIDVGAAYICFCKREEMQELRHVGKECECRKQSPQEAKEFWKQFIAGKYTEGEATLRFKGDMQNANHIMRDSALFRIVKAPHFKHGTKYKAWPLYDFYNPLEDALMGITHVLRSNEFDVRVELHDAIRKFLSLPPVIIVQYGRFNVIGAETKGRDIRQRIEAGEYSGWDDPRLVTLKTLQRRGITREVFYELVNHIGLSKKEIHIDFAMVAAISRKLLDTKTPRYYFVAEPHELNIRDMPRDLKTVEIKFHPDKTETRSVKIGKEVFIAEKDYGQFKGTEIRLMNLCNLQLDSEPVCTGVENKKVQKIQWVSSGAVKTKIRMDDGSWLLGLGEPALKKLKVGDIVQFERFGFVRLDKKNKTELEFWFAHH